MSNPFFSPVALGIALGLTACADEPALPTQTTAAVEVTCGSARCNAGEVCANQAGANRCYARGTEPNVQSGVPASQWPAALLYCDGDEDCSNGLRCIVTAGEVVRAECRPEGGACASHGGHICSTDADCHPCGDPAKVMTCALMLVEGTTHLKRCVFTP